MSGAPLLAPPVIYDGRPLRDALARETGDLVAANGIRPCLRLLGVRHDDPRAEVNVRIHRRYLESVGIRVDATLVEGDDPQTHLCDAVERANDDPEIDATLVLLPVPPSVDIRVVLAHMDPAKEVEGLHVAHAVTRLPLASPLDAPGVPPVVPEAVLRLLFDLDRPIDDITVVVLTDPHLIATNPVSRAITGGGLLGSLPPGAVGTVVPLTHPRASTICADADILLVSVERPRLVTADWVKPGALVVDFNAMLERTGDGTGPRLVGGLDTASVATRAGTVAGIPGGFGPVLMGTLGLRVAQAAVVRRTAAARS